MSTEQLTRQLLTLPLTERIALAQALWQSIDEENGLTLDKGGTASADLARSRDADLTSGLVVGRTHEEVMAAARRLPECD